MDSCWVGWSAGQVDPSSDIEREDSEVASWLCEYQYKIPWSVITDS